MENIELVIKIPKKWLNDMKREEFIHVDELCEAILHGTPLPKGHGKLKDENEIFECIRNRVENLKNDSQFIKYRKDIDLLGTIPHIRNEVRTIIEADKAESE